MSSETPILITIAHDDYHASHVGRTSDGSQFFLTTPFVPAWPQNPGREFVALYLFNADGSLREARIDDLGTRAKPEKDRNSVFKQRLAELGPIEYCNIQVQPFRIERFGAIFGLILRPQ